MVQPRAKPKPGPKTRPARTRVKKTVSMPAVPAPSGRRAAPRADSTPSMAMALASIPPSAISAKTTANTRTSRAPNMSGAMVVSPNVPGADHERPEEGHEAEERGHDEDQPRAAARSRDRRAVRGTISRPSRQAPRHLVHGQVGERGQDLGHLRGEGRRRGEDVGRRPVGDDVAGRHHDHPVGGGGDELDVVGGDDDRPALGGQQVDDADERPLGSDSRGPGSARRAGPPGARRPAGWPAPGRAAGPRRGRGDGRSSGMPGASRSSSCAGRRAPTATGRTRGRPGRTPRRPCRGRAGRPGSGARGRPAAGPRPAESDLGRSPSTWTEPALAGPGALERPQQRGLARAVAAHQGGDLAAAQVEVDAADGDDRRRSGPRTLRAAERGAARRRAGDRRGGGTGRRRPSRLARSGPAWRRASRTDSGSGCQPASRPSSTTGGATAVGGQHRRRLARR